MRIAYNLLTSFQKANLSTIVDCFSKNTLFSLYMEVSPIATKKMGSGKEPIFAHSEDIIIQTDIVIKIPAKNMVISMQK
jgi:hypothetical protein